MYFQSHVYVGNFVAYSYNTLSFNCRKRGFSLCNTLSRLMSHDLVRSLQYYLIPLPLHL